jgi:isoprenylcysteine carboxyl methyltransferase (ICMT) family protein YpbQ
MLNEQLGLLVLSSLQVLAYVVVAQMGSFWLIKAIINKKGDVE